MKKLIISFLGRGKYSPSLYYRLEDEKTVVKQRLSPLANAYIEKQKGNEVKLIFLITKEVKNDISVRENEYMVKVASEIDKLRNQGVNVVYEEGIGKGETYNQLEDIMDLIRSLIEENKDYEIIFDLTHGLRHMGIFTSGVIFYLKNSMESLSKKEVKILYGAYEIGKEIEEDGKKIRKVPIIDVSPTLELSDLTIALQEFENYGIVKGVISALKKIQKIVENNKFGDPKKLHFDSISTQLNFFNDVLKVTTSPEEISKVIYKINSLIDESIEEFKTYKDKSHKYFFYRPIETFLLSLKKTISNSIPIGTSVNKYPHFATIEKAEFMSNFIKLLLNWEMYSEAMLHIRELAVDLQLLAKGKFFYYNSRIIRKQSYKLEGSIDKEVSGKLNKLFEKVIAPIRNAIAHAGRGRNFVDKESLIKNLKNAIDIVDDILEGLKGRNLLPNKVYLINSIITPLPKKDEEGDFYILKIEENEFKYVLKNQIENNLLDSAIGHESIKGFIKENFSLDIPLDRKEIFFKPGEAALAIKLEKRPEESRIYTREEMDDMRENDLVGYYFIYRK